MSDFANDLAGVINTVADKVKEYGGYAKIQALIKAEEAKKLDLYYKLGKKYYELYKDEPASDLMDFIEQLASVDNKIEEYKADLKAAQEACYTDVSDVKCDKSQEEVSDDTQACEDPDVVTEEVDEIADYEAQVE